MYLLNKGTYRNMHYPGLLPSSHFFCTVNHWVWLILMFLISSQIHLLLFTFLVQAPTVFCLECCKRFLHVTLSPYTPLSLSLPRWYLKHIHLPAELLSAFGEKIKLLMIWPCFLSNSFFYNHFLNTLLCPCWTFYSYSNLPGFLFSSEP